MKEFYLVPIHEMEDLQNSSKASMNHVSMNPEKKERKVFDNENINNEAKIEIQGHINRLLRDSNGKNNGVVMSSDSESRPLKMQENEIKLKNHRYLKIIYSSVPNGLEEKAYNLISKLEKTNVISIDNLGYVTLNGTDDEVKLKDLLRAIFVRKARVSHIESFLTKIIIHIDYNLIKNEKMIKLSSHEKSVKDEYESHTDDDHSEIFEDTLQDSRLSLSGGGRIPVTNKIIKWIIY